MVLKCKGDYGSMPQSKIKKYGISPVDGKENLKVWPKGSKVFRLVKGEKYNVKEPHPHFEGGSKVSGDKKVSSDSKRPADKGSRSSD